MLSLQAAIDECDTYLDTEEVKSARKTRDQIDKMRNSEAHSLHEGININTSRNSSGNGGSAHSRLGFSHAQSLHEPSLLGNGGIGSNSGRRVVVNSMSSSREVVVRTTANAHAHAHASASASRNSSAWSSASSSTPMSQPPRVLKVRSQVAGVHRAGVDIGLSSLSPSDKEKKQTVEETSSQLEEG